MAREQPPSLVVLTGGSGVGKTTLIDRLSALGYRTVPEASMRVISALNSLIGTESQLAWRTRHKQAFADLLGTVAVEQETQEASASEGGTGFLDRSVLDCLGYARVRGYEPPAFLTPAVQRQSAARIKAVFIVEPLDSMRAEALAARNEASGRATDPAGARQVCEVMGEVYSRLGCSTSRLADGSVEDRLRQLLRECGLPPPPPPPPARRRRRLLRAWLLAVAALRLISVAIALLHPASLARRVFAAAPEQLTPLGARVFGAWTATSCVLCGLCASEGADPATATFSATAWSFVVALALFVPEAAARQGSMTVGSAGSPLAIAATSLVWMAAVRWPGRDASLWAVAIAGSASVAVAAAMLRTEAAMGFPDRLDASLAWDESSAAERLARLGPSGRREYRAMYVSPLGDMALPLCYAPALAALCWRSFSRRPLALLPLLAGACDLLENVSVLRLLDTFPRLEQAPLALAVGPWATFGKWAGLALTFALLAAHARARGGPAQKGRSQAWSSTTKSE